MITRSIQDVRMNNSTWTNVSSFQWNIVNDCSDFINSFRCDDIYLFIMCSLDLPGNILVILVYVVNMKTSTRVYMFALAVADLTACVCGVDVAAADMKYSITFNWLIRASIYFSATLLVFVSIERLIAVKRPHTFSMDSRRPKRALLDIALTAVLFTTVRDIYVHSYTHSKMWRPLEMTLIGSGIMVMIICYTSIAIVLLNRITNENVARLPEVGPANAGVSQSGASIRF